MTLNIVIGVVSFLAGMILMDVLWAWKTGFLGYLYRRVTNR